MKSVHLFVFIVVILMLVHYCEPISIPSIRNVFGAIFNMFSPSAEYCSKPWISFDKTGLKNSLREDLFGQPLVEFTVFRTLNGHFTQKKHRKALVMSFHGPTGSGKNFVSRKIAESLYKKGTQSKFVHQYIANKDFPHEENVSEYQDKIRNDIMKFTKMCDHSLFIFDEVDKMPAGTLDALKPFIDYYEPIDNVDYRENIFIFLSNAGSQGIVNVTLEFWAQGKDREEITMKDIEPVISKESFNELGGFLFSRLLSSELVDLFVPFLPLEKKQVRKCIKAYMSSHYSLLNQKVINKVADELIYYPEGAELYSTSGCKRIEQKVDVELSD